MISLSCSVTVLCTLSPHNAGASYRFLSTASAVRLKRWNSLSAVTLNLGTFSSYFWLSSILNCSSYLVVLPCNGCDDYKISNSTSQHTHLSMMFLFLISFFSLLLIVNFCSFIVSLTCHISCHDLKRWYSVYVANYQSFYMLQGIVIDHNNSLRPRFNYSYDFQNSWVWFQFQMMISIYREQCGRLLWVSKT